MYEQMKALLQYVSRKVCEITFTILFKESQHIWTVAITTIALWGHC